MSKYLSPEELNNLKCIDMPREFFENQKYKNLSSGSKILWAVLWNQVPEEKRIESVKGEPFKIRIIEKKLLILVTSDKQELRKYLSELTRAKLILFEDHKKGIATIFAV